MAMIKILNLYAGIGGNRKLWKDVTVTAVEHNEGIANIYQDLYPNDKVIVADAHEFLLKHYAYFDFIWSSPPCSTHSRIRKMGVKRKRYIAVYPDPQLWQEIILLQHFAEVPWVIENVRAYYDPIIPPSFELNRHCFWSNFRVYSKHIQNRTLPLKKTNGTERRFGFDLSRYNILDKRSALRNLVDPEIGLHIFETAKTMTIMKSKSQE